MSKVYVVEFTLDESDGPWSELERSEAFDKIEDAISEQGGNITRYVEEKDEDNG